MPEHARETVSVCAGVWIGVMYSLVAATQPGSIAGLVDSLAVNRNLRVLVVGLLFGGPLVWSVRGVSGP